MLKIKEITLIDSCTECDFYEKYTGHEDSGFIVTACKKTGHAISACIDKKDGNDYVEIPNWCPLKTFVENKDACDANYKTVILDGLEWMTENVTGHGGTEINGNWYYTWEQAKKAAEEVGNGWRLPTEDEFRKLCELGITWDNERKGRWLCKNKELFFPAFGYTIEFSSTLELVGCVGYYWSYSPLFYGSHSEESGCLYFGSASIGVLNGNDPYAYSVRLVRDIMPKEEKPKTVIFNNLEWMTENLTGHGGTEINGNWYYTWEQAKKAAEKIGDGWRLPTNEEFEALINGESVWDIENNGRLFGGKMSLKATGFLYNTLNSVKATGVEGNYWGRSVDSDVKAVYLCFHSTHNNNYVANCRTGAIWLSCSVRLVRDIKK